MFKQIQEWPASIEVIFVFVENSFPHFEFQDLVAETSSRIIGVTSKPGRAIQQNRGAQAATRTYLWFLHADTRLTANTLDVLNQLLRTETKDLCFFNLAFLPDGPQMVHLNSLGLWLRGHLLKLPFGDQGFVLQKSIFFELGQFDTETTYGEDHLLVWRAHQSGIRVRPLQSWILTSARKYQSQGWWQTTREHLKLTYKQARPEFVKLIQTKVNKRIGD